ncbi:uncharacterized protein LOC126669606 [Mercurialis annua]|uniref:uncharacterized protein LOC126669606 n=1 Tax=Mercurialis annua TaxID=3986 RepID=UPI0021604257|nr:uncharacterized protein LOC126669606 [Mercurialis annua]
MSLVGLAIDVDDNFPNKLSVGLQRRSSSLPSMSHLTLVDSISYCMLPEEPLKLSILKLDGSTFDIDVKKTATVADLKEAVEIVFSHMPQKGPDKISWPHVWSHFCLMFEGQKLVTETDSIRYYGIRDGDQLQFVRHISTSYNLRKKRSSKHIAASEHHRISLSSRYIYEERDHDNKDDDDHCDMETGVSNENNDIDDIFKHKDSRWAGFVQRLFPYSRLPTSERNSKGSSPSRSTCSLLGNFKKVIQFCGDRDSHYSQKNEWRGD